jgi:hypothetical protein
VFISEPGEIINMVVRTIDVAGVVSQHQDLLAGGTGPIGPGLYYRSRVFQVVLEKAAKVVKGAQPSLARP